MKKTLSFNLPEEKYESICAEFGTSLYRTLSDIDDFCRSADKYNNDEYSEETMEVLDKIRTLIREDSIYSMIHEQG